MPSQGLDRREFHQLTLAVLGGVVAGTTIGCGNRLETPKSTISQPSSLSDKPTGKMTLSARAEEEILNEPHTCRGLNSCKGLGRDKENACAGQGTCASIADAACSGQNDCHGQGGCGSNPGMNECKGQGGCSVPLMGMAWETARNAFELAMTKNNKNYGSAPAKR